MATSHVIEIRQDPEKVGQCYKLAADLSIKHNLFYMIGRANHLEDGGGKWHAVSAGLIMGKLFVMDPTLSADMCIERLDYAKAIGGFQIVLSLRAREVSDFLKKTGRYPTPATWPLVAP